MPKHVNKQASILLVDDEATDRKFMQRTLERKGYTVFVATDSRSALEIFQRNCNEIHMLLTDVALPGMNGCDLARSVLAMKGSVRVLFVSGHVGAEVCKLYGFPVEDLHFLRKPFSADQLHDRVSQVLHSSAPLPLGSAGSAA